MHYVLIISFCNPRSWFLLRSMWRCMYRPFLSTPVEVMWYSQRRHPLAEQTTVLRFMLMGNGDECQNKSHALVAGTPDTSDLDVWRAALSTVGSGHQGGFIQTGPIPFITRTNVGRLIMLIYNWYHISILFSQGQKYMEIFRTGYLTWFIHVIFHGSINILNICPVEGLSWIMWVFSLHISSFEQVQMAQLK